MSTRPVANELVYLAFHLVLVDAHTDIRSPTVCSMKQPRVKLQLYSQGPQF